MSRRIILAWVAVVMGGVPAWAQVPYARDLIPTRTALARVGLERQFLALVPLSADEQVLSISISEDLAFAQTNKGYFHTYDSETGRPLWSARLGATAGRSRPASSNSFAIFVTNLNKLFALDRRTGREIWSMRLPALPSSSTSCDEHRVMVGLATGKIYAYKLKEKSSDPKAKATVEHIATRPIEAWNWQTDGTMQTRPMPAGMFVAFGSDDGKLYVSLAEERTMLYRIATEGPIGAGFGTFGTRLLLVPSADRNLYGVDLLTSNLLWTFSSGAPIAQEPIVAGNDIFVVNNAGMLSSLDPSNGSIRWTTSTQGGRLVSVGARRIYLESSDGDLFLIDRATGQTIATPRGTFERAGLNLRPFRLTWTNRFNDRLYFGTSSGMMICLREIGQTRPRLLRDPKEPPFGTIPRKGVSLTAPGLEAGAAPGSPAAPGEDKPAEDKPAAEAVPAPGEEKPGAEPAK